MISGYETYSYSRRKPASPAWRVVRVFLLMALLYFLVTELLLFTVRIDSASMEPALSPGESVFVSPLAFGVALPFAPDEIRRYRQPRRGELVVFMGPAGQNGSWHREALGRTVRFVTFNRRGTIAPLQVKRVIGVPGDTITLEGMIAHVRPGEHIGFQIESDVVPVEYSINTRIAADSWKEGLPFSGDLAAITLEEGQYFLLGDNRSHSSDSRAWGPVRVDDIRGKVILRYWPPRRFGQP